MLTIIFNGHKITGEVKDIYEFIKLAESEVVSEKNDEVDLGECGDCVAAWRDGVPCPDKDSYCPHKKHNSVEEEMSAKLKGMKDFYECLSCGERELVYNIIRLKDKDAESIKFVDTCDSEHNEGQWLSFIIHYYGGHDRFLEVNYKAKKFVYFKINEGLSVDNLMLTEDLKKCLADYEQETIGKWWKK